MTARCGPEADAGPAVAVLDADQRSALAAVRSLGRRGVRVLAAGTSRRTLAGASRYCAGSFVYPSPEQDAESFLQVLRAELAARGCGVVFPMTDVTTALLADGSGPLCGAIVPVADGPALDRLNDKWQLYCLARSLGLPVPRTERIEPTALCGARLPLPYPCVLKPVRSRARAGAEWLAGQVHHLAGPADLARALACDPCLERVPYLLQERVAGGGQGVFALFDRGRPVTFFAHRRLREKPPTGGVSVLCESLPVDARLRDIAQELLGAVGWHGVAMVEFKVAADGRPHLIEINPRFWGSLQLAIDAGVDFPWLLYQVATGATIQAPDSYTPRVRSRWILGDADALYLTLRSDRPLAEKLGALLGFFQPSPRRTRHEVNRLDDFRPFLHELGDYVRALRA